MKLQACKFQRVSTMAKERKAGKKLKHEFSWETGVAVLQSFNDGEVDYIIDESGKKVPHKEMYCWVLTNKLAMSAIDTKYEGQ